MDCQPEFRDTMAKRANLVTAMMQHQNRRSRVKTQEGKPRYAVAQVAPNLVSQPIAPILRALLMHASWQILR